MVASEDPTERRNGLAPSRRFEQDRSSAFGEVTKVLGARAEGIVRIQLARIGFHVRVDQAWYESTMGPSRFQSSHSMAMVRT